MRGFYVVIASGVTLLLLISAVLRAKERVRKYIDEQRNIAFNEGAYENYRRGFADGDAWRLNHPRVIDPADQLLAEMFHGLEKHLQTQAPKAE